MRVRIVACKSKGLIPWLIRLNTKSPYDHLGLMASESRMIDASTDGVALRPLPDAYDVFEVEMATEAWKGACSWLCCQMGKPYDYFALPGLALYTALGWREKSNPLEVRGKYFCSELVFRFCEVGGIKLMDDMDSSNFHPGRIIYSKATYVRTVKPKRTYDE